MRALRAISATSLSTVRTLVAATARTITMATVPAELAPYVVEKSTSVAALQADAAFAGLTDKEARYALAVGNACWAGQGIVLLQSSPEAVPIFTLLRLIFKDGVAALREAAAAAGVSRDDFDAFLTYAATFVDNSSNYKSFGDTKFIPGVLVETAAAIVSSSSAWSTHPLTRELWDAVRGPMYDLAPRLRQLAVGPTAGITTYYSANFDEADGARVGRFIESTGMPQPYNTRVFKFAAGGSASASSTAPTAAASATTPTPGKVHYEIRLASAATGKADATVVPPAMCGVREFEGCTFEVVCGDYSPLMARVCAHLTEAIHHAANPTQAAMLRRYIASFRYGGVEDHVDASRHWVKDVGPAVESYVGFIESYRDPLGTRGEWEGFVAVVNKETSAKFKTLVDNAETMLTHLPWGPTYEKDTFHRPDFTSLEVLGYCGSGIPAGINIPNYDQVRQHEGFKNVSLSNVLSARDYKDRITFLRTADQEGFKTKVAAAFEVQVGLHELLGHGSGKLLMQAEDGSLNFDPATTIDPTTGAAVASWYKPGQTWDSMFGSSASAIEECRAEAVGIFLCCEGEVLKIFGHEADGKEIVYANWLNMARAGLLALQFYTPATKKWGQAHMQARFALLRVMLEAGGGFVEIVGQDALTAATVATAVEGEGGVHVRLDETKIRSVGLPAVGAFLKTLQVYKATANVAACTAMFDAYTAVPDAWLPLRDLVVAKRKPRQLFVQPLLEPVPATSGAAAAAATGGAAASTSPDGSVVVHGKTQSAVQMRTFPATTEGIVASLVARFPEVDEDLLALWRAEAPVHKLE